MYSIAVLVLCLGHVYCQQDYFTNLLGQVSLVPYAGSGTSAVHASDLNCDFSRPCCWSNVGPPRDELDWVQATTLPTDQKFRNVFGSVQKPNTPYLISSSDAAASSVYAILNSCILQCQADTGTLSFKKWTSAQVNLDVCTLPLGSDSYNFCQTVTETGPDVSVPIPPQNGPFQVVITSSNFVLQPASAAIIDDVTYNANVETCPNATTPPAPTPPPIVPVPTTVVYLSTLPPQPPPYCSTIRCAFVGTLCGYSGTTGSCPFVSTSGRTVKWAGGVPSGPGGGSYAGAGLGPGAKAILASPTFTTDLPARIGFKYFDGPAGVTLKACVDSDANCQFVSSSQALAADRQWKDAYIDVPQGTHTIYFTASNEGAELSGVGIADINLVSYGGQAISC